MPSHVYFQSMCAARTAANQAAREKREVADRLALPKSDPESDRMSDGSGWTDSQ